MLRIRKRSSSSDATAVPRPTLNEIGESENKISPGGQSLGRLVAVRRATLGLSQEDLAARIDTTPAYVARIEEGRPPSPKTVKRLAAALDLDPVPTLWNSLGQRWLWAGLAIAILIPVLVIVNGRFFGTDGGDSSQPSPQAVSAAPAPPVVGPEAEEKARKAKSPAPQQDRRKSAKERASGDKRSSSGVPRGSVPQPADAGRRPPRVTPRPKPPAPSGTPVPSQPPSAGGPSAPSHTTGKPVGSPGNGPVAGNGPAGTDPPGQTR